MSDLYVNDHYQQTAPQWSATTKSSGCTWTSLANGVDAVSHGERKPGPDRIHSLVKPSEETSPATKGWSIPDADLAMKRLGFPFRNLTGGRWEGIVHEHEAGRYVIAQGDSDRFANNTCSGKFDGDHCIGIHPDTKTEDGEEWWRINDSICPNGRWERRRTIREYVEDLDILCRYGSFTTKVPEKNDPILRYGARALPGPTSKKVHEPAGVEANVRRRPTSESAKLGTKPGGSTFVAYQRTNEGQRLDGSRVWFGNRRGRRWMHESAFD